MIDILLRRSFNPISEISISSILINPDGSAVLNNVDNRDDLPAPVRPQTPTLKQQIDMCACAITHE